MNGAVTTLRSSAETAAKDRPQLSDFDLNEDIDFESLEAQANSNRKRRERYENITSNLAILSFFGGGAFSLYSGASDSNNTFFYWIVTAGFTFFLIHISERIRGWFPDSELWLDFRRYQAALHQWEEQEERKKLDFWRNLKGRDLEQEVATLFRRFDWKVELTKATGDRGVDLIVVSDGQVFWCQCKGHSKPVAGAEVRRIAGAALASSNRAAPVLIASNGFTKPAIEEARDLEVICIDGITLSQVARRTLKPDSVDELDIARRGARPPSG